MRPRAIAFAGLALLVGAACSRDAGEAPQTETQPATEVASEALRVTGVQLGSAIGPDMRVTAEADEFRPSDTIYVTVATEGTASGSTLRARWTFEDGQVVDETTRTISPTGPAVTEFHISKPDGFPAGDYRVEILLNGTSVETRDFEVSE